MPDAALVTVMYQEFGGGGSMYNYGSPIEDAYDTALSDDSDIRRLPDREVKPKNYISSCVQIFLFSFNFLFWLIGLAIVGIFLWLLVEVKNKSVRDALDIFFDPSILICIVGAVIFILAFFGCLGALRENICLLRVYYVALVVLMIAELLLGVMVFIFYYIPDAWHAIGLRAPDQILKQAIIRYRDDDDVRDMIDTVQKEFKCCGYNDMGFKDWQQNMYFNCSSSNPSVERCGVPHSCCIMKQGDPINVMCGFDTTNKESTQVQNKIYVQGCLKGFSSWLERNFVIIGGIYLGMLFPQIAGICLACTLVEQIQMQRAQWR